MNPFTLFIVLYVGSALIGTLVLWLWHDRQDRLSFEIHRRRKAFHCVRCGFLYSLRKHDVSKGEPCPECGYKNYELSF